jgi:hypothetical protein
MTNPLFVETSAGLINLSLVQTIKKHPNGQMALWFEEEESCVLIPEKEWQSVWTKMAEAGMLLVE